jgi:cation-transporting ATPase F
VWHIGVFSNRWLILGVTAQAIAQAAITYLPAMNTIFGTAPIGGAAWLRIFAMATAVSVVVAINKWFPRMRLPRHSPD